MSQYLDLDGLKVLVSKIKENGTFISPNLAGVPTTTTADSGTNNTQIANTAFVQAAIAQLVGSAPETLDTLKELGDALGNDPNFATTIAKQLGLKAPLASPNFTGTPVAPTAISGTNNTQIANTAFVTNAINSKTEFISGSNINIQADSDNSLATEYVSIKAGGNELKIQSSAGGTTPIKSNTNLTYNGNIVYHAGNKPSQLDVGLGNVTNESKTTMFTNATLTGTPTAPTAVANTNNTQIATTQFVNTAITNKTVISGNAGTATKLQTARTITLSGNVSGSATFDGSNNITINTTGISAIPITSITDLFK